MAVHRFVNARLKAGDAVLIRLHADIAPCAAPRANRWSLIEIPNPHFETKIPIGQRADRTNIDDVGRQRIVEHRVVEQRNGRVIAAIDHRQLVGLGDLLAETHAASAFDAALAVENHVGSEDRALAIVDLAHFEATRLAIVLHVVILQPALARLIADRTVHRMIDQQKFQHRFAHRQHLGTLGQNRHALGHLRVAGDLQLGHFLDLDHAHAAIARDGKLRMIAIARNRDADIVGRLNDRLAFGGDDFRPVDGDFYRIHIEDWSNGVLECWGNVSPPTTPLLQYSITPSLSSPCIFSPQRALRIRRETCV